MMMRTPRSAASAMRSSIATRNGPFRDDGRMGVFSSITGGSGEP
jgi:hypothetical protein